MWFFVNMTLHVVACLGENKKKKNEKIKNKNLQIHQVIDTCFQKKTSHTLNELEAYAKQNFEDNKNRF